MAGRPTVNQRETGPSGPPRGKSQDQRYQDARDQWGNSPWYGRSGDANPMPWSGPQGPGRDGQRQPFWTPDAGDPRNAGYWAPENHSMDPAIAQAHAANRAAYGADPAYAAAAAGGDLKGAIARMTQMKQDAQQQRFVDQGGTAATWQNRFDPNNNWPVPRSPSGNYQYGPGRPGPQPPNVAGGGASTGVGETMSGGGQGGLDGLRGQFMNTNDWHWNDQRNGWEGYDWGDTNNLADYNENVGGIANGQFVPWDASMGSAPPSFAGGKFDASVRGVEPRGNRDWWNSNNGSVSNGMTGLLAARAKAQRNLGGVQLPDPSRFGQPAGSTNDAVPGGARASSTAAMQDIGRTGGPVFNYPTGPRTPVGGGGGGYTPVNTNPDPRTFPATGGGPDLMSLYGLNPGGMNSSPFNYGMPSADLGGMLRFGGYRPASSQAMMSPTLYY